MSSSAILTRSSTIGIVVLVFLHAVDGLIAPGTSPFLGKVPSLLRSTTNDEEIALNPIVASVKVSKTVEVFGLVKQMEADGETVTSLCVGEPDFPPHRAVLEAAMAAISGGDTRYTAVTGTADLRNAIAKDLKRRKGLEYNPQTEIVVGNGVSVLSLCLSLDSACACGAYTLRFSYTEGETIGVSRHLGNLWDRRCCCDSCAVLAKLPRDGFAGGR